MTKPATLNNMLSIIKGRKVPITATTPMERLVPKPTPAILHAKPKSNVPKPHMKLKRITSTIDDADTSFKILFTLSNPPAQKIQMGIFIMVA